MLLPRILTALVILPLFLFALFGTSRNGWGAAMLLVVAAACFEWSRLIALPTAGRVSLLVAVVLGCLGLALIHPGAGGTMMLGVAFLFWAVAVPFWLQGRGSPSRVSLAAAGLIVLCSAWYALFDLHQSAPRLLALMCVVWIADTAAYFVGRSLGRHKLAPHISPGKTWEGVAGGCAGVGVYYGLLWWVWSAPYLVETRFLDLAIVVGMTILSVEGDLFESWLKRRAGVKDSGSILPGHGGVLDRIDGVVAALPFAALLTRMS